MRRIALIAAAVALLALQGGIAMGAKPASISVAPTSVSSSGDSFVITYDGCRTLRVTNPNGDSTDIAVPVTTGSSTVDGGIANYPYYSGPGTYIWACVWANGQVLASAPLEVI
jgi:hypothetical protein